MSIRNLSFEKDEKGDWYVILPEWTGNHEDLQMVSGADKLLDFISNGKDTVSIRLLRKNTKEPVKIALGRRMYVSGGAIYDVINHTGAQFTSKDLHVSEIWICSVTRYVLHVFPEVLNITWE